MDPIVLSILGIILVFIIATLIRDAVTLSTDDFFKKIWLKTLWLWLPIHAFGRLSKEFREKYLK